MSEVIEGLKSWVWGMPTIGWTRVLAKSSGLRTRAVRGTEVVVVVNPYLPTGIRSVDAMEAAGLVGV